MDITYYKTPIGIAKIVGDDNGIVSVSVIDGDVNYSGSIPESLQKCVDQLEEYFQKSRTDFDIKLNPQGTDFQKKYGKNFRKSHMVKQ